MNSYLKDYTFTDDWFTMHIPNWEKLLEEFRDEPHLRFLEIGTYDGRSCLWLLENILTDPTSMIVCIDPYPDRGEHREIFLRNVELSERSEQVVYVDEKSQTALRHLLIDFDFIYIDGHHTTKAAFQDASLSRNILKRGGIIVFDNYQGNFDAVRRAVNYFIDIFGDEFEVEYLSRIVVGNYITGQVAARKR